MIRRLILIVLAVLPSGCFNSHANVSNDNVIRVGDSVNDVKRRLERWGATVANFAVSLAVRADGEKLEVFQRRADEIRRRNVFCEQPYYSIPPKAIVHFEASDGKLVAISKVEVLGANAGNMTFEPGFSAVYSNGRFKR